MTRENATSHVVMEYDAPMIHAQTGAVVRKGGWYSTACFHNMPDGFAAAERWAMAGRNDAGNGPQKVILSLPREEAKLLDNSNRISQRELDLLVSLSAEMIAA